ncbi:MAG TPA: AMP-binding protein [Anaerolineae bacterium]|nr:AMP-binding protein [Anaerolineae bacterium]
MMPTNFLQKILNNCLQTPDKTAIELIDDDNQSTTITYAQLAANIDHATHFLQQFDIQTGDRVALQLPKSLTFIYLYFATIRLNAIALPLNTAYPAQELHYYLEDAAASLFIADKAQQDELAPLQQQIPTLTHLHFINPFATDDILATAPTDLTIPAPTTMANSQTILWGPDDQTALMIYTSGTTGRPKGAEITLGNLTANLQDLHQAWGWQENDILLHVLPIFHVHGLIVALHGALYAGATTIMLTRFDAAQALQLLQDRLCTVFMGVPTIHQRLLAVPNAANYNLAHMRLLTSGSDRLADDVFAAFQNTFGHTLLERYGMTETGMNLSNPLDGERRPGSVGFPLPSVEVRIVDRETDEILGDDQVGEVQIRGPHVCKGYWRQPEKTKAAFTPDGWLRTGDLGLRQPDGYHILKGRDKDLIITGGYNVYPPEVELVLKEYPGVAACAVIGCPNEEWGETVTAVIIPTPNTILNPDAIIDHCCQKLAKYKAPRHIIFADELPRNALGKVQKARLRQSLC